MCRCLGLCGGVVSSVCDSHLLYTRLCKGAVDSNASFAAVFPTCTGQCDYQFLYLVIIIWSHSVRLALIQDMLVPILQF